MLETISKIKRQMISWENHNCNMTGEQPMLMYEQLLQIIKKKVNLSKYNRQITKIQIASKKMK